MYRLAKLALPLFVLFLACVYAGGLGAFAFTQIEHTKTWESAKIATTKVAAAELQTIDSAAKHDGMTGLFKSCTRQAKKVSGMYLVCEMSRSPITYRGQTASGELMLTTFASRNDATAYIAGDIADDFMWDQYRRVRAPFRANM